MKNVLELYDEIVASEDLKKELAGVGAESSRLKAFLEEHGCSATLLRPFRHRLRDAALRDAGPDSPGAVTGAVQRNGRVSPAVP